MAEESVDWDSVAYTLRRMVDNIRAGMSELCELGYYRGCNTISRQVLPVLKRMMDYAESRVGEEEVYEVLEIPPTEETPEYYELYSRELPPRGEGLVRGTAGERRGGVPRTEAERRARHRTLYPEEKEELF